MKHLSLLITLSFLICMLTACGGGGGGGSTPPSNTGDNWDEMNWDEGKWG